MKSRIHSLLIVKLMDGLTPEEEKELDDFKAATPENKKIVDRLTDRLQLKESVQLLRSLNVDAAWQKAKIHAATTLILPAMTQVSNKSRLTKDVAASIVEKLNSGELDDFITWINQIVKPRIK